MNRQKLTVSEEIKAVTSADEPFVNLFQMQWKRTKQATFTAPDFAAKAWYGYASEANPHVGNC
jgi:hypothetical protein